MWTVAVVVFYSLHFLHLSADFPNGSPWSDWVKYTDEGWYLNAAVRQTLLGHWYLPGDFNPAVALPAWPLLAGLLFHVTGVSIAAVRALVVGLFGITLLSTYLFARRHSSVRAALAIVSFAVTSPFLFAFGRLAIVEPVLLCVFSLALLTADVAGAVRGKVSAPAVHCLVGWLLVLMLFTKTTAVFLYPAVAYVFWRSARRAAMSIYRPASVITLVFVASVACYWAAVLHLHLGADFHYLFEANRFPQPSTLERWLVDLRFCLAGVFSTDRTLAIAAAVALLISMTRSVRWIWATPLFATACLTLAGNLFFLLWHNYQAPHYYLFVPIPLAVILISAATAVAGRIPVIARRAVFSLIVFIVGAQAIATAGVAVHPRYTFLNAAKGISAYMEQHANGRRILVGESADQVSLMSRVPSICDDFGTEPLRDEVARVQPGWFVSWNSVDPPTLDELHRVYHLQRAATFSVMDDPRRSRLVLYRLVSVRLPEAGVEISPPGLSMEHRPR